MLGFILGSSKSGKSRYIENEIFEISKNPNGKRVWLIVPEQFSLEAEKRLFSRLTPSLFANVRVTSFSRLSSEIFKEYGGIQKKYADDCAKNILLSHAVDEMADELTLYKKAAGTVGFKSALLRTIGELKHGDVTPSDLSRAIELSENAVLNRKLNELSLIYGSYDALLQNSFLDHLDDTARAARLLEENSFFGDSLVYIDEFKGFTASEIRLLKYIMKDADGVKIALCMDLKENDSNDNNDSSNSNGIFSSVFKTYNIILRTARQSGVSVAPSIQLEKSYFKTDELAHMEKNIFNSAPLRYEGKNENISAVLCQNEYDEVEYSAATISNIIRQNNYSYNDIAIISRDISLYMPIIETVFNRYHIPFFSDKVSPICEKPLLRFLENLLACTSQGATTENILAMLKCGLTPFSIEEISDLENYIFVWDIKKSRFSTPFTGSPRGFKEKLSPRDSEELERINRLREFIYDATNEFKEQARNSDGIGICKAIITLLEKVGVKDEIEKKIKYLEEGSQLVEAEDYRRTWELLMELLNTMALTINDRKITIEKFFELFLLCEKTYEIGSLPQTIDCVIAGNADRIRTTDKKAVIILGCNEDVFPLTATDSGIFTAKEQQALLSLELSFAKSPIDILLEERFIAYKAMTSPLCKLYMTSRKADIEGTVKLPTELFDRLSFIFGEAIVTDTQDMDAGFFCGTKKAAFATLARIWHDGTPLKSSLKSVLLEDEEFSPKVKKLIAAENRADFKIEDAGVARELFGKDMKISPTRAETFYKCHFRYFCEHGLRAFPLRRAAFDPLETGNLIHRVLSVLIEKGNLAEYFNEDIIYDMITAELDDYIETVMGGDADKSKRFLYLYNRTVNTLLELARRLHMELLQSKFVPTDFEYEINENSEITPLKLYGDNDVSISVVGKIDRIDCYTAKNGKKYVRIIDYKSGEKKFDLNDVLNGLNMQMLLYLHCIEKNGRGKYHDSLPAGILYMPAGEQKPELSRDATPENIIAARCKGYRMNGLILDDSEVIEAMEADVGGVFIPITTKADGSFSDRGQSLASLEQLSKISNYIERLIINMANDLSRGDVSACPIKGGCDYCGYSTVCGVTADTAVRDNMKFKLNHEIFEQMEVKEDE